MKKKIKYWIKRLCNWRFLICFGLAWMITNGWCYVFIGVGTFLGINWMLAVGSSYAAFLWLPFTPEKLITIPLSLLFLRLFFPKDKKMQEELQAEFDKEKSSILKKKKKEKAE